MYRTSIQKNDLYKKYFENLEVGKLYRHTDNCFHTALWHSGEKIRYYSFAQGEPRIDISSTNDIFIITKEMNWVQIDILFGSKTYYRDFFFSNINFTTKQLFNLID